MGKFILILILLTGIILNIFGWQSFAISYESMVNTDTRMPAGLSLDNKNKDSLSLENDDKQKKDTLYLSKGEGDFKEESSPIQEDLFSNTKRVIFGIISSLGLEGTQEQKELEESTE